MATFCISIRSFNRPHYLKWQIASLNSNVDLADVDFFFVQDGAVNRKTGIRYADDKDIKACISLIKNSNLPNCQIHIQSDNRGNLGSKIYQLNNLFPKYQYLMLVDDDLVFNKYYTKTIKHLFRQFAHHPKAGMIQTSFRHTGTNFQSFQEAKNLENKATFGFSHRCEQGFWKHSLSLILPHMQTYFKLMQEVDFNEFFNNKSSYPKEKLMIRSKYDGAFADDHVLEVCTQRAGYLGLHTLASRYKIIGAKGGYTFSHSRWQNQNFGNIILHEVGDVDTYELVES